MNVDKLYKIGTIPIERVDEVVIGEEYCTDTGATIRIVSGEEIELVRSTPLVDDELVEMLTERQLKLFWTLREKTGFRHG